MHANAGRLHACSAGFRVMHVRDPTTIHMIFLYIPANFACVLALSAQVHSFESICVCRFRFVLRSQAQAV
eukprot:2705677-Pleurochrysis_carterae.AAC.3